MIHLKLSKSGATNISDFSGSISTKHDSIMKLTRLVVLISLVLALLMVVSK